VGKYIVRRLLQMIPVILGATFLIFAMVFALPGDPTAGKCGERPCSPAYVAKFKEEHNLNDPLLVQYGKYVGKLVQGDLGTNFYGIPVKDELAKRYVTTGKLALMAVLWETVIGITAGVLAGIRKGRFIDNLVLVSTLFVISIPIFVIGATAQMFLGVRMGLFPVTVSPEATFYELLLPSLVLGSASVAYIARLTRTNMVENLRADYVRTAIAKGLTRRRAVGLHTLRNSLIPVVTYIGVDVGAPRRCHRHRAHLQHPGRRRLPLPQHRRPRRRGRRRHGDRPGHRLPVLQPARRPAVRRARPEDQP
jgi:oligopeptide transport system permease protein